MSRISSLAANTALVNQVLRTQSRIFDLQTQVASGRVSQDYTGIAVDSQRHLNLENTRDSLDQFTRNNEQMETRLNIASAAIEGIRHRVTQVIVQGNEGAFRVEVVGVTGTSMRLFGWVEFSLRHPTRPDFMVAWMKTRLKGYSIHTGFMEKGFCSSYTPSPSVLGI